MTRPDPVELVAVALPVFAAEAAVVVALLLFAAITVNGHSIFAAIVGMGP